MSEQDSSGPGTESILDQILSGGIESVTSDVTVDDDDGVESEPSKSFLGKGVSVVPLSLIHI